MKSPIRLAIALVACGSLGGFCGPGDPDLPPLPEACSDPAPSTTATLVIGAPVYDDRDLRLFPLQDGGVMKPLTGGQGTDMVGFRIAFEGMDAPTCVQAMASVRLDGIPLRPDTLNLKLSPRNGQMVSDNLFSIPENGATGEAVIRVEAAGAVLERTVRMDYNVPAPPPSDWTLSPETVQMLRNESSQVTLTLDTPATEERVFQPYSTSLGVFDVRGVSMGRVSIPVGETVAIMEVESGGLATGTAELIVEAFGPEVVASVSVTVSDP